VGLLDSIGTMLRSGRERAGLSQQAAAGAVGIDGTLLGCYEAGRRQPPLGVAAALARLYGTSIEALAAGEEGDEAGIDVSGILLRAAPRELAERARAGLRLFELRLAEYVELAQEMSTAMGPEMGPKIGAALAGPGSSPLAPARTAGAKEAAWAARELRRHLNLGSGALADPFGALDKQVLAWRMPLGENTDEAPSGFFYNHPQAGFCVAVNSEMTLGRQVFTLAHELAHACFHSHDHGAVVCMPGGDRGRERFADAFAGEFLVPGDELRRVIGELSVFEELANPTLIVHLQRRFGVSFAILRLRLLQEKLITPGEYDALAETSPSRLARALGYPDDAGGLHPLAAQPARVLLLVRAALERSAITPGDAAEILGTGTEEVRQLLAAAGGPRDLQDAASGHRER
jgi:Zn-dependent peptidase ImmA (M78 family)/transcriptional regulator with XRE-family HTH domain